MNPGQPTRGALHNARLKVRVTPRSSRNQISGILEDGTVKIRLTQPPVEGQANTALVKFLAEMLEISPSKIEIIAGQRGKDKLITINGLDLQIVKERILAQLK